MALTPDAVVEKRFQTTKFREGYDQDEVDDFLDEVVNELRRMNAENEELRSKLAACERRVADLSRGGGAQAMAAKPVPKPEPKPEPKPLAPVGLGAMGGMSMGGAGSSEAATGMLALAQKLHDEHVRSGEQKRDQMIREAESHAARLVAEAEQKQRETLGSLERERSLLERKIDELRAFERDYRTRLKSYLESQLRDLESKGSIVPGRSPQGPGESSLGFGSAS